jgi:hypothetical protein
VPPSRPPRPIVGKSADSLLGRPLARKGDAEGGSPPSAAQECTERVPRSESTESRRKSKLTDPRSISFGYSPQRSTSGMDNNVPAAAATREIEFAVTITQPIGDKPPGVIVEFESVDDQIAYERALIERGVGALVRTALAGAPGHALFDASIVANDIARALAPRLRAAVRSATIPHNDTFVDQDAGFFDREIYLRLARSGAFPVKKVGKKRVARWGDVNAGFIQAGASITLSEPSDDPETDLLNEIRQRAGLAVRGGR